MIRLFSTILLFIIGNYAFAQQLFTIPFQVKGDRIFLRADINNTPRVFIFDTGAFSNSVDSTFNAENKLNINPRNPIANVETGSFKIQDSFGVLDHRKYGGVQYDGVIGIKFFKDFLVEIDFITKTLKLYNRNDGIMHEFFKMNTTHHKNNMKIFGLFTTPLTIYLSDADSITGNFLIDTGSSRNITLLEGFYPYLKETNLNHFYNDYLNASSHGFSKSVYYKIPKVDFSDFFIKELIIDCSYGENGEISDYCDGIIGIKLLKNFNFIFDYEGSQVYIKKNDLKDGFFNEYVSDGIDIKHQKSKSENFIVFSVIKGNENSIKLGDEVLKINGMEPSDSLLIESKRTAGTKLKYTIKRKRKIFEAETVVKKLL